MAKTPTPRLQDLENAEADAVAAPIVPPGVDADFTVKFKQRAQPLNVPDPTRYASDIEDLALEEDENLAPADPLSAFIEEWHRYQGYTLRVVRLPDPATRRQPGQTYNRPNFGTIEHLGDTAFDPGSIIGTLQIINRNSGGIFRIWLVDPNSNEPIPGARLDNLAIGDPLHYEQPREREREPRQFIQQPPPPPPEKTAIERQMEELQIRLLTDAITRAANPPAPPAPIDNTSEQDKALLFLIKEGGVLPAMIEKVANIAGSPEQVAVKETFGEKALNVGLQIAQSNPALVDRLSNTLYAIVDRILPDPNRPRVTHQPPVQPLPVQRHPQQPRSVAPLPPAPAPEPTITPAPTIAIQHEETGRLVLDFPANDPIPSGWQRVELSPDDPALASPTGLPEVPDPNEDPDEDEDDDIMAILEDVFTLLSGTIPLRADDPIFLQLRKEYPIKFRVAMQLISDLSLEQIIAWISEQSPLYESMLTGNSSIALHYRNRLQELQTLVRTPAPQQPQQTEHSNAETTNDEAS